MIRLTSLRLLLNVWKSTTQNSKYIRAFGSYRNWCPKIKLFGLGLIKNPANGILVPVLFQISFFRKSNESEDHITKGLKLADNYYNNLQYEDADNLLTTLLGEDPTANDELLWRLARVKYELSKTAAKEPKEALLEEALKYVKQALTVNDQNGYAHKWLAILLDSISSSKGIKERIELCLQTRDHLLEALKYIPNDGTTHYILGVWYYSIADFNWCTRKIASTVNPNFPATTFEEALECFKQAEVVEPDFYSRNYLFLGKCYMKFQENDRAIEFLTKARDYVQKTQEDKETHTEAKTLLEKLERK